MLAMKVCLERVLPRCHERPVTFSLPSLAAIGNGEIDEPSSQNVSRAMNAVTAALACGEITPGEAATIAGVYETFVRTAGTAKEKVARGNLLQISNSITVSHRPTADPRGMKPGHVALSFAQRRRHRGRLMHGAKEPVLQLDRGRRSTPKCAMGPEKGSGARFLEFL